ncbi:ORF6N domain-containing protein [bacterium]|nr:ORF6N domain-containing protein [bacterium]
MNELVPIQNMIYIIRGQRVMLDSDLAMLYEVPTHRLNEAVKRHSKRFPQDFMFQLTKSEYDFLISQFAMSKKGRGGRRFMPYVFTEQGVAMLSSVLNSDMAIEINVKVIRAFVLLRQYAIAHSSQNQEIAELRKLLMLYIEKNDSRVNDIIRVLNNLIQAPPEHKQIGFKIDK